MSNNRTIIIAAIAVALIAGVMLMYPRLQPEEDDSGIKITASFYPLAYFAEEIGGEHVQVSTLIPYNSEVHSWQPSISDIAETEESDLIIYLGAGLDHWVEDDILDTINTDDKVILEASTGIALFVEEGHTVDDGHDHDEGDPHLWVSPYTAYLIAENIYTAIKEADPDNTDYYTELAPAAGKTFFTTHSAYGYLAYRYGLEQHGVIGLSADEQPSTAQITEIVEAMVAENSYVIYVDPVYSTEYAETLQTELTSRTGEPVEILELYLMLGPLDDLDYLGQLEANLDNLKQGLVE
ncbi:MAG: zinc ABC transporter substrate-binding protein [Candidatus Bathyarchaeota archaeon]|nr:zinc ABC transporter substrate-binding protein [Candidatus Bathyarchaeota archaeon]